MSDHPPAEEPVRKSQLIAKTLNEQVVVDGRAALKKEIGNGKQGSRRRSRGV